MNKLSTEDRASILHLLCEGNAIRAVARLTGASKNTVAKLVEDAGNACLAYHDAHVRNVKATRLHVNENWSFTHARQKNVATANAAPEDSGDIWTWTAIETDTKLIVSYLVGSCDNDYAIAFMDDLQSRLTNCVQLTSDGPKAYLEANEGAFGGDIDYAMLVEIYSSASQSSKGRYSPAECTGARKERIEASFDPAHVSTSYRERQNLTMRMHMRRLTRLTNAFSKKVESHAYAVALHIMYYNFVRVHSKLRTSPAMAAGASDRLWEVADIVALVEANEAMEDRKRGPYKK